MEKQSNRTRQQRRGCRLLGIRSTLGIALCLALLSAAPCYAQTNSLVLRPEKRGYLISETIVYTLIIPGALPQDVVFETPRIPGLALETMKKTAGAFEGNSAAIITLAYTPEQTGIVSPASFTITVRGAPQKVSAAPLTVYNDPALIIPSITLDFAPAQNIRAGERIFFTVQVHDAREMLSLEWALNPDSLVREVSREAFLARFEWIPLVSGIVALPHFNAQVITVTGERKTITLQDVTAAVVPAAKKTNSAEQGKKSASDAFIENAFGNN
jgi:hypothetical protein